MAITSSAKKARRVSERKRVFNLRRIRTMKETMKNVVKAAKDGSKAAAEKLSEAYKAIDKALKRGVIKKSTAARRKSRIARMLAGKK